MPSPFNNEKPVEKSTGALVGSIEITNSSLTCEECWEIVENGRYWPEAKRLVFVCSEGHENVVRGIEI